jgi:putative membrane protein insertion efficiency factor
MDLPRIVQGTAVTIAAYLVQIFQVAKGFFLPHTCRYYPTCSTYTIDALRKYGMTRGSWKALKRISRCHPFRPGGYDPA